MGFARFWGRSKEEKRPKDEPYVNPTAQEIDRKERLLNPGMYGAEEAPPVLDGTPLKKKNLSSAFLDDASEGTFSAINTPRGKRSAVTENTSSGVLEPPEDSPISTGPPPGSFAAALLAERERKDREAARQRRRPSPSTAPFGTPVLRTPAVHVPRGFDPVTKRPCLGPAPRRHQRSSLDRPHGTTVPVKPLRGPGVGEKRVRPNPLVDRSDRSNFSLVRSSPAHSALTEPDAPGLALDVDMPPLPAPTPPAKAQPSLKERLDKVLNAPRRTRNFETTGSCRSMSRREMGILGCILVLGLIVLIAMAPWSEGDAEAIPSTEDLKSRLPNDRRTVDAAFRYGGSGARIWGTPPRIPVQKFRAEGLRFTIRLSSGTPFRASNIGGDVAGKLQLSSNSDPKASPSSFAAHAGAIQRSARVEVRKNAIDVQLPKGSGVHGHLEETVSVFFDGEGGDGFPVQFVLTPEELHIPNEEKTVDAGSKAAAAGAALTAIGAGGVGQGLGSLPRLSMVAAAFNCPSEEYFEVEWIEHPLLLVGFEEVEWGSEPGLAAHIATMIGAYIILMSATIILLFLLAVHRVVAGTTFAESAAVVGFPSYLTPFLIFLSPGIAITATTTLFHSPDIGVQVFAFVTFCTLIVVPAAYFVHSMRCARFKQGLQYVERRPDDPLMKYWLTKFIFGEFEWVAPDGNRVGTLFFGQHAMFLQDYRHHAKLFLLMEFAITVSMGMAEAIKPPDEAGCRWKSWSILLANTVHFGSLWFMEPLLARYEAFYAMVLSGVLEGMLVCVVINQNTMSDDRGTHWTTLAAGDMAMIEVWLIKIKVFFDLAFAILETALTGECAGRKVFKPDVVVAERKLSIELPVEEAEDQVSMIDADLDRATDNASFYPIHDVPNVSSESSKPDFLKFARYGRS
eukprot:TRINITY_DN8231_c0_g1_i1.p1 TRINITY_DN8231_c0_g1~~TRINITY_DN8231_c0_g1_i1.p1  ORF type:complete len:906 (+),score=254.21 TRINITY_DN8231_c0_g1_i1:181-2898(+)